MNEYLVGFEEEFSKKVYARVPEAMNMYEAGQLQEEATLAAVELLTTLGYAPQVDRRGVIEVDRPIGSEGHNAIRNMFSEFRIISWDKQDRGAAPLVLKERTLETLTEEFTL